MSKLRILAVMDRDLVPPDRIDGLSEKDIAPWRMEYDVISTLRKMKHEVRALGVFDDLAELRAAIADFKPSIVFNMLVEFAERTVFVQHVLSYLELIGQRYTGCNPMGWFLTQNKALTKKILTYHRIRVPAFATYPRGKAIVRPKKLEFPLLVKSTTVQGSVGISQASVVYDDEKLQERVKFIHEQTQSDAMAARYIDGRELYVGMIGNRRVRPLPVWELTFENLPEGAPKIATEKVKWDPKYQRRAGIRSGPAENLPEGMEGRIHHICKRVFRLLNMSGYARMDLRLTDSGDIYLLEANPNPHLALEEDFAASAAHGGIKYKRLLERIINLGLRYRAPWHV